MADVLFGVSTYDGMVVNLTDSSLACLQFLGEEFQHLTLNPRLRAEGQGSC